MKIIKTIMSLGVFFIILIIPQSYALTYLNDCTNISASGTYYLNNDIFEVNTTCFIINTSNILLDCQGHTIDANYSVSSDLSIYGIYVNAAEYGPLNNITILNCSLTDFNIGLVISGNIVNDTTSSRIEDLNISNSIKEGLIISHATYMNIKNINSSNNGEDGIDLSFVDDSDATNLITNYNGGAGIRASFYSNNNRLINITSKFNKIGLSTSSNTVINATLQENVDEDLSSECSDIVINITGSGNRPIGYFNSSVNLQNEVFSQLFLCDADWSNLTNITIIGSKEHKNNGIYVYNTDYSIFENINSSNNYYGLYLSASTNNLIINGVFNNNYYGVYSTCTSLTDPTYNKYMHITAKYNSLRGLNILCSNEYVYFGDVGYNQYGINLDGRNNILYKLHIHHNTYGAKISSNNHINSSLIDSNSYGIYLYYSFNNTVYNNILNNTNNFYTYSYYSNNWNTTLQPGPNIVDRPFICGNVYANPSGTGYSETCIDDNYDGICDQPYTILTDNIDYCPLALSKTYPLNPKIYVGDQLVWQYDGLFNTSIKINITSEILDYISNKCISLPCSILLTYKADSRGGINILTDLRHFLKGYIIKVENIMHKNTYIKNITIISKDYKKICSTNQSNTLKIPPGMLRIFKIPCKIVRCNDIEDIIVETTCGIKDKLSYHPLIERVLKC